MRGGRAAWRYASPVWLAEYHRVVHGVFIPTLSQHCPPSCLRASRSSRLKRRCAHVRERGRPLSERSYVTKNKSIRERGGRPGSVTEPATDNRLRFIEHAADRATLTEWARRCEVTSGLLSVRIAKLGVSVALARWQIVAAGADQRRRREDQETDREKRRRLRCSITTEPSFPFNNELRRKVRRENNLDAR